MAGTAGRIAHRRCRRNRSNGGRGPVACRAVFSWLARAAVTQATPFSLFFFSGTMRTKTTGQVGCGGARRRGETMRTELGDDACSGSGNENEAQPGTHGWRRVWPDDLQGGSKFE